MAVHLSAQDTCYGEQLQQAAEQYQQKTGKRLAALLVTNPDNPTGTVYPEERLVQMLKWCVRNRVHLIRYNSSHVEMLWSHCSEHATIPTSVT